MADVVLMNSQASAVTWPGVQRVRLTVDGGSTVDFTLGSGGEDNLIPRITGTITSADLTGVSSIKDYAFYDCHYLSSVSVPDLEIVPKYAFAACYELSKIVLPECSEISANGFETCIRMTEADMPKLKIIQSSAFAGCSSLINISAPLISYINQFAFYGCRLLSEISLSKLQYLGTGAFNSCGSLKSIAIPSEVTSIFAYTFSSCSILSKVDWIPSKYSLASIGTSAFARCYSLSSFNISNYISVRYIGSSAFFSCSVLGNLYLNYTTAIFNHAFYLCIRLSNVIIDNPYNSSVTIYANAFGNCYSLISLYLLGSAYASLVGGSGVFSSTPIGGYSAYTGRYGSIFVRESMLSSYKTRAYWSYFSSRMVGLTDAEVEALRA